MDRSVACILALHCREHEGVQSPIEKSYLEHGSLGRKVQLSVRMDSQTPISAQERRTDSSSWQFPKHVQVLQGRVRVWGTLHRYNMSRHVAPTNSDRRPKAEGRLTTRSLVVPDKEVTTRVSIYYVTGNHISIVSGPFSSPSNLGKTRCCHNVIIFDETHQTPRGNTYQGTISFHAP